jgi:hypothetical protein
MASPLPDREGFPRYNSMAGYAYSPVAGIVDAGRDQPLSGITDPGYNRWRMVISFAVVAVGGANSKGKCTARIEQTRRETRS